MSNASLLVRARLVAEVASASLHVEKLESQRRCVPNTTGTHAQQLRLGKAIKEAKAIRDAWQSILRLAEWADDDAEDVPGVPE